MIDPRIRKAVDDAWGAINTVRNVLIDLDAESDATPAAVPAIPPPAFATEPPTEYAELYNRMLVAESADERNAVIPRAGQLDKDVALFLIRNGCLQGSGMGTGINFSGGRFPMTMEQAEAFVTTQVQPGDPGASGRF